MNRFLAAETDKTRISTGFFSVLYTATITSLLLSIIFFVSADQFTELFLKGTDAAATIRLFAFLVFLTTLDQIILEYFAAFRHIFTYSIFTVIQVISELSLIIVLILNGMGINGAIISLLFIRTLIFLCGFLYVKRQLIFVKPDFGVLKRYLTFSLPLFPYTFCYWFIGIGGRYIIGYFTDAVQVGIYAAAYGLGNLIQLFYMPIVVVLLPTFTFLFENKRMEEIVKLGSNTIKIFLTLAIPVVFGFLVLAEPLLRIVTTNEFAQAYLIIPIVAFGYIFYCLGDIYAQLLMIFKKTGLISLIYTISTLVSLLLTAILVPFIGILGSAFAVLIAFIVHFIVLLIVGRKYIVMKFDYKFIIKCVLSSILMGIILYIINPEELISIILSILAGGVLYVACLILTKAYNREQLAFLINLIKR